MSIMKGINSRLAIDKLAFPHQNLVLVTCPWTLCHSVFPSALVCQIVTRLVDPLAMFLPFLVLPLIHVIVLTRLMPS